MSNTAASILAASLLAGALAGCSDPAPVDARGTYTVSLTNQENGCNFQNWVVGQSSTGITVAISQEDDAASADVQGGSALYLDLALGAHVFTGTVDGHHLDLKIVGNRAGSMNACAYTYNATIDAGLAGDVLTGNILYQAQTNNSPDCGALTGCTTSQAFNGTRPPM